MFLTRRLSQSFLLSSIIHMTILFLLFFIFSEEQKQDTEIETFVQLMKEKRKPMPRQPKETVKPLRKFKDPSFLDITREASSEIPRGFLAKKQISQVGMRKAGSQIAQSQVILPSSSKVTVAEENRAEYKILPADSVEEGRLEIEKERKGKGEVGKLALNRSAVSLNRREKLFSLAPQSLMQESKLKGLSMVNKASAMGIEKALEDVNKDIFMDRTGFGVPKLPKGEPGGIVIGRGKEVRGYLRLPRVDCSILDRSIVERYFSLAIPNLMKWINANTNIKMDMSVEGGGIQLTDGNLFDSPVIFLLGSYDAIGIHGYMGKPVGWSNDPNLPPSRARDRLTDIERRRLREYLVEKGGILVVDTLARLNTPRKEEYPWSKKMRGELREILPEYPMERIPRDHELYHCYYTLGGPPPGISTSYLGFAFARQPYLEGIFINGRLAVIYSQKGYTYMMTGYHGYPLTPSVFRMMTNIIVYALTHSGISDHSRYVPEKEIQGEIPKKPPFIPQPTPRSLRP